MECARDRRHRQFDPDDEVIPGVPFGRPEWVPTPAFWAALADQEGEDADAYVSPSGTPLLEDVAFCLLGGYGIKMEVNRAAWACLSDAGIFKPEAEPTCDDIERLLSEPLLVDGRRVRYRFPRQRADRLAVALQTLKAAPPATHDPLAFRESLMTLPGIGPKTASWIVRNWSGTDAVAILDVHVLRAGTMIGLFPQDYRLPRDYGALERRFLDFALALQVPASLLDALIWREMRVLAR